MARLTLHCQIRVWQELPTRYVLQCGPCWYAQTKAEVHIYVHIFPAKKKYIFFIRYILFGLIWLSRTRPTRPTYHNGKPRLSGRRGRSLRTPCASASGIAIEIPLHAYLTARCGVGHPVDGLGNPVTVDARRLYISYCTL